MEPSRHGQLAPDQQQVRTTSSRHGHPRGPAPRKSRIAFVLAISGQIRRVPAISAVPGPPRASRPLRRRRERHGIRFKLLRRPELLDAGRIRRPGDPRPRWTSFLRAKSARHAPFRLGLDRGGRAALLPARSACTRASRIDRFHSTRLGYLPFAR